MVPRMDNRMYTNLILTVIAVVLLAGAAREYGVGFAGSAQAQNRNLDDISVTDTGVVYDDTIPQTQDVAVAAATSQVAAANLQIAAAIRELADAVRGGLSSLSEDLGRGAAPAATGSSAPAGRPTIEVGP